MNPYELPTSLTINGVGYSIRTDYKDILTVLMAFNDKQLDESDKAIAMLKIVYKDWKSIPTEHIQEALKKASEFIDCGNNDDGKHHPKTVDWEQDANIIIPAVNKVAHTEIRALSYMHWWTFLSYYMEIGESLFASVVNIRIKKAEGKKLEKYEQEFYKKNKYLIDFEKKEQRSTEEKEALRALFGFK